MNASRRFVLNILFLSLVFKPGGLMAQEQKERFVQERLVENRRIRELERFTALEPKEEAVLAKTKRFLVDFGGWVDLYYTEYYDDDNNRQEKDVFDADLSVDTRAWVQALFRPRVTGEYIHEHSIYVRFKNFYISRWPNEEQPAAQDDNDGPHVDLLYLDLDFRWAKLSAGRRYFLLGQGISYANVHDGIELSGALKPVELKSFFSTTLPHEENIDYSVPGFDKTSDRYFAGTELAWLASERVRVYGYFLSQQDRSDPNPAVGQDYAYQSQYYGLGASASEFRGFSSWCEYILESGSGAIYESEDRNGVFAQAANAGGRYEVAWPTHPEVTVEYAYGSGDKDRTSVTNTEGGNSKGKDHNFLSFGIYPSGYALAPALSNLHILRIGGALKPLDFHWQFKRLKIGSDLYFYWKANKIGGIYDIDAVKVSSTVGKEFNAHLYWQVVSDIFVGVKYGMFFPGNAFPPESNDSEIYLSTSFTFVF